MHRPKRIAFVLALLATTIAAGGYECTVVHPRDGGQTVVVKMHADGGFRWDVPVDR
jgi:hypothetical protein